MRSDLIGYCRLDVLLVFLLVLFSDTVIWLVNFNSIFLKFDFDLVNLI